MSIGFDGELFLFISPPEERERALMRIDKHFAGNNKKQSIEFEYINK